MKYKFKVGDKVKMTVESFGRGLNRSIGLDQVMFVKELTVWNSGPAYRLNEKLGPSTGIWCETEIEPFEEEITVVDTQSKKVHTTTMWALVNKNKPNKIGENYIFLTREEARRVKSYGKLENLKVVKVNLKWEG